MPRLKRLSIQRLYRPGKGNPAAYPNLQLILTRPIAWALIRNQYDQMAASQALSTPEPRRQSPSYAASPAPISSTQPSGRSRSSAEP